MVVDHSRFHPCVFLLWVDLGNPVDVLRKINYHRNVAALACKACTAASSQDGHAKFLAGTNGLDNVVNAFRDDDSDGHLPKDRQVGGVECPRARIEPNFRASAAFKSGSKFVYCIGRWTVKRWQHVNPSFLNL
jgi:predicted metal-binding protein